MDATAQAVKPDAPTPPLVRRGVAEPAQRAHLRGTSPRLTVWEERARKMGFPPTQR